MEINIIYNSVLPGWESNTKLPAIIFKDCIAGSLSYCRLQPQRLFFSGAVQYPVSSHWLYGFLPSRRIPSTQVP